jgi:serine protease Do
MKSGDVITKFNGQPVENANHLKLRVAETAPRMTVPVEVNRNGEAKAFNVTLKELTKNEVAGAGPQQNNGGNQNALHAVAVADLDQQTRGDLNIPANVHGALVTEVDPSSAAYESGLRTGDVILEINHNPVKDAQDAVSETAKRTGDVTLVKVWSQEGIHYLTVQEPNVG